MEELNVSPVLAELMILFNLSSALERESGSIPHFRIPSCRAPGPNHIQLMFDQNRIKRVRRPHIHTLPRFNRTTGIQFIPTL